MAVASPRKSLNMVFQRVGGCYGYGMDQPNCPDDDMIVKEAEEGGNLELMEIGAERTKNVLILMSDTGGGHRASAEAIRDAFRLEFGDEYEVFVLLNV